MPNRSPEPYTATDFVSEALNPAEIVAQLVGKDDLHFEVSVALQAILGHTRARLMQFCDALDDKVVLTVAPGQWGEQEVASVAWREN